jgi:hypothetical protein
MTKNFRLTLPSIWRETMATTNENCAVHGCTLPTSPRANLCAEHMLPGLVVQDADSGKYLVIPLGQRNTAMR